jgi:hypothetical protein
MESGFRACFSGLVEKSGKWATGQGESGPDNSKPLAYIWKIMILGSKILA